MKALLEHFLYSYLKERNEEATLACLTENVLNVGTGSHEISCGKAAFHDLLCREKRQLPDPMRYYIDSYDENRIGAVCGNVLASLRVYLDDAYGVAEMKARFTASCVKEDGIWRFSSLHFSVADRAQDNGSFFPMLYGESVILNPSETIDAALTELIAQNLPAGIIGTYLDDGFSLYTINRKSLDILGYTYEELLSITEGQLIRIVAPEDRNRVAETLHALLATSEEYEIEYRVIGNGGRVFWVNNVGRKVTTEQGHYVTISLMTDISERVERERVLQFEANHDALTGLNNRQSAVKQMEEEFTKHDGGVFFICDVDHFKEVNDTLGHAVGDTVLIHLAELIRARIGGDAIAARLGGDEYILFVYERVSHADAVSMIEQIRCEFFQYMQELAPELSVSLSIGGVVRREKESFKELYEVADAALYQAKKQQGNLLILEEGTLS